MLMFTYVLQSDVDGTQYVGMTENPDRRLTEHNNGMVFWTKRKKPWKRILLEDWPDRRSARKREKYLKSAAGRRFRKSFVVEHRYPPERPNIVRSGGS